MDWKECIQKRVVKDVKNDKNTIESIRDIAKLKIESAKILPKSHFISIICLMYDALRELLEAIALERGFKIYNHECYTPFIKEIMDLPNEADMFDKLRKIRNSINYYGRHFDMEESDKILIDLKLLINKFK
jgi:hypothetical protein